MDQPNHIANNSIKNAASNEDKKSLQGTVAPDRSRNSARNRQMNADTPLVRKPAPSNNASESLSRESVEQHDSVGGSHDEVDKKTPSKEDFDIIKKQLFQAASIQSHCKPSNPLSLEVGHRSSNASVVLAAEYETKPSAASNEVFSVVAVEPSKSERRVRKQVAKCPPEVKSSTVTMTGVRIRRPSDNKTTAPVYEKLYADSLKKNEGSIASTTTPTTTPPNTPPVKYVDSPPVITPAASSTIPQNDYRLGMAPLFTSTEFTVNPPTFPQPKQPSVVELKTSDGDSKLQLSPCRKSFSETSNANKGPTVGEYPFALKSSEPTTNTSPSLYKLYSNNMTGAVSDISPRLPQTTPSIPPNTVDNKSRINCNRNVSHFKKKIGNGKVYNKRVSCVPVIKGTVLIYES